MAPSRETLHLLLKPSCVDVAANRDPNHGPFVGLTGGLGSEQMSSIQVLSKVTREMTNSLFVWLPLNMSVFDEMVDIFQEGIAMVTEC